LNGIVEADFAPQAHVRQQRASERFSDGPDLIDRLLSGTLSTAEGNFAVAIKVGLAILQHAYHATNNRFAFDKWLDLPIDQLLDSIACRGWEWGCPEQVRDNAKTCDLVV